MATCNRTKPQSCPGNHKSSNQRLRFSDSRISNLPDSVLLHILSFLPTQYVVRTSILSKRFELLWTRVPCLSFEDGSMIGMTFLKFVNRVLLLNSSGIQKFRIKCTSGYESYEVESWIMNAVTRNVKELDVIIGYLKFNLPRSTFTCKTLVVLKLTGRMMITVPTSACIPNLKTLVLDSVRYQDDESASNLISCCPVLEKLSICRKRLSADNVKKFRIYAPQLKCLEIDFDFDLDCHEDQEHGLHISAPSLQYLDIKDYHSDTLLLTNVGSLNKAIIDLEKPTACQSLIECFGAFNNLKFLSLLSGRSFKKKDINLEPGGLTDVILFNLTHLTMEVGCAWRQLLPYFFVSLPNLEVLRLKLEEKLYAAPNNHKCIEPELLPKRLFSHLRVVEIEDFWDTKDDLGMLKYILKHGKVLETVQIHIHYTQPVRLSPSDFTTRKGGKAREFEEKFLESDRKRSELELKFHIVQEISGFPRGSDICKITFS